MSVTDDVISHRPQRIIILVWTTGVETRTRTRTTDGEKRKLEDDVNERKMKGGDREGGRKEG